MISSQINALDPNSLSSLKLAAKNNSPEANKAVAQQFEAMFLQIVMKSMRDATSSAGLFDSDATRMYQSVYDQQLTSVMSQSGGMGLAKFIERQLDGSASLRPPTYDLKGPPTDQNQAVSKSSASTGLSVPYSAGAQEFVAQVWPQAQQAANSLGVPAHFLVAQAALETGWGKSVIARADGTSSNNLFNIKAGKDWKGAVVEARTTEYENGQPVTRTERFRAYGSYAESFQDYANLVGQSSRYASVRGQTSAEGFSRALQQGGYATDPAYAEKLTRVINGNTLRQGLTASAQ
ncbi:MAG: flgJ [Proteobacteria bacterium]|nr:flgJ [Pseudomonadota bacterium]